MILSIGLQSKRGFTLIELILVLLLLSIVFGLALPNFRESAKKIELKTAVQQLTQLMRYAQSEAMARNQTLSLKFDETLSNYRFVIDTGIEEQKMTGFLEGVFTFPDGIKVTVDESIIQFHPDGTMDKEKIVACYQSRCFTVSTQEQRARVVMYEGQS